MEVTRRNVVVPQASTFAARSRLRSPFSVNPRSIPCPQTELSSHVASRHVTSRHPPPPFSLDRPNAPLPPRALASLQPAMG